MPRLLYLVIFLALAVWSWRRARERKDPLRNFLVAFWILLATYQFLRSTSLLFLAFVCLALYSVFAIRRRNRIANGLKEIQKAAGLSDEEFAAICDAEPERQEEAEPAALVPREQEADLRVQARAEPFELRISVDEERSFATENAGLLCVKPGSTWVRVKMEPCDWGGGIVGIRYRTFLCDSDGLEWVAESFVATYSWLDCLDAPEDAAFTKWTSAPPAWLKAMTENCAAAELTDLRDSRECHELTLDGVTYPFFEKYQLPIVDIAWLNDEKLWLVRVRRIRRDWRDDPPEFEGEERIPAFAWTVPFETGLLLLKPDAHVVNRDDIYESPENRSERVTFRATARRGRPQPNVTLAKPN